MEEFLATIVFDLPAYICLLIGLILMIVEIFIPGFGVPGISGLILLVVGVVLKADSVTEGLITVIVIIAILGVALSISIRSVSKGALSKTPLILGTSSTREEGYVSVEDLSYFLGHEGNTLTVLRPAGMANFDGVKLDVVSEGDFIAADTPVTVVRVEGRRIVVRNI